MKHLTILLLGLIIALCALAGCRTVTQTNSSRTEVLDSLIIRERIVNIAIPTLTDTITNIIRRDSVIVGIKRVSQNDSAMLRWYPQRNYFTVYYPRDSLRYPVTDSNRIRIVKEVQTREVRVEPSWWEWIKIIIVSLMALIVFGMFVLMAWIIFTDKPKQQ